MKSDPVRNRSRRKTSWLAFLITGCTASYALPIRAPIYFLFIFSLSKALRPKIEDAMSPISRWQNRRPTVLRGSLGVKRIDPTLWQDFANVCTVTWLLLFSPSDNRSTKRAKSTSGLESKFTPRRSTKAGCRESDSRAMIAPHDLSNVLFCV